MTIAVHGSYFGYNFGDTLLCRLFSNWVHDAGETTVLPLASEGNRKIIGAERKGVLATSGARGLVFCGGGYFSQPAENVKSWSRRAYMRHIWLGEAALARGTPYVILGVGAGPMTQPWLRARVARVFEGAQEVVVRDDESYAFLRELGVQRPITVAMDAALGVGDGAVQASDPPAVLIEARKSAQNVLLLHTNAYPNEGELDVIRTGLAWAATQPSVAVILASDSVGRKRPIKWPALLSKEFPELANRTHIALYNGSPDSLVSLLGQVDGIMTTKLHVGIVGTALERPVISVPRHTKTPRFYRQIGISNTCVLAEGDWKPQVKDRLEAWLGGHREDFAEMRRVRAGFSYRDVIAKFVAGLS